MERGRTPAGACVRQAGLARGSLPCAPRLCERGPEGLTGATQQLGKLVQGWTLGNSKVPDSALGAVPMGPGGFSRRRRLNR